MSPLMIVSRQTSPCGDGPLVPPAVGMAAQVVVTVAPQKSNLEQLYEATPDVVCLCLSQETYILTPGSGKKMNGKSGLSWRRRRECSNPMYRVKVSTHHGWQIQVGTVLVISCYGKFLEMLATPGLQ